mmetsp:Transcript_12060/g.27559  ORF Transcript_12060/g.27559 Transcript_12060/m.27559 type:complete len:228 (-) Transcript_12060:6-689(-)
MEIFWAIMDFSSSTFVAGSTSKTRVRSWNACMRPFSQTEVSRVAGTSTLSSKPLTRGLEMNRGGQSSRPKPIQSTYRVAISMWSSKWVVLQKRLTSSRAMFSWSATACLSSRMVCCAENPSIMQFLGNFVLSSTVRSVPSSRNLILMGFSSSASFAALSCATSTSSCSSGGRFESLWERKCWGSLYFSLMLGMPIAARAMPSMAALCPRATQALAGWATAGELPPLS